MTKIKRSLIGITLVICVSVVSVPAHADETTDDILTAVSLFAWTVASPEIAYPLALDKNVWQFLIDSMLPFMSPYGEQLRQVALKAAPRLKPTATPPRPMGKTIANSYSQVISFGDSMSDNGNMFEVGMKLANWGLPMPPNDNGRFSNGPVVLEVMSYLLKIPLLNYAFGGGESGYDGLVPAYGFQIGVLQQVDDFISNVGLFRSADSKALYVIWTGPDDFYAGINIYLPSVVKTVTDNIQTGMTKLYKKGARNFFIPMMPDLSITPSATAHAKNQDGYLEEAHARSVELATSLMAMLRSFAKRYPLAKVRTFDMFTYSQVEYNRAAIQGINVTESCYNPPFMGLPGPVCASPDKYLFWDLNHPTAEGSRAIGEAFAYGAVSAPLPSR